MRSHIDCFGDLQNLPSWHAAQVVKDAFQGIIDIQLCTLTSVTRCDDANFPTLCKDIAIAGGVLGAFVPPAFQDQPMLERFLAHADAFGLDVDFHIDENLTDRLPVVEQLADAVIATGFQGRVMAGHVCALLNTQGSDFDRVLDKIATAGISIVSLPRTNLYLQDRRGGDTPRRRGITAVHEMRARGISVSFGTDNVADAFYPFGDYDMIGLFRDATVAAHLDQDLNGWLSAITNTPARALGFDNAGKIAPGLPANAVLLPATNWPDLLNDKRGGRINMIAGKRLTPEMIPQPKGHA
jgi:cytosine deaminase